MQRTSGFPHMGKLRPQKGDWLQWGAGSQSSNSSPQASLVNQLICSVAFVLFCVRACMCVCVSVCERVVPREADRRRQGPRPEGRRRMGRGRERRARGARCPLPAGGRSHVPLSPQQPGPPGSRRAPGLGSRRARRPCQPAARLLTAAFHFRLPERPSGRLSTQLLPCQVIIRGLNVIFHSHMPYFNYGSYETSCVFKSPITLSLLSNVNCKKRQLKAITHVLRADYDDSLWYL